MSNWNEEDHPRQPAGSPRGGEWTTAERAARVGAFENEYRQIIHNYTLSGYRDLNRPLREGTLSDDQRVRDLDEAIKMLQSEISQRTLYRALYSTPEELGIREGAEYIDLAYISTSRDPRYMYGLQSPTRVVIRTPKGTKGVYVEKFSYKRDEREILLPRGSVFRVLSVKFNENNKWDVEMEYVK